MSKRTKEEKEHTPEQQKAFQDDQKEASSGNFNSAVAAAHRSMLPGWRSQENQNLYSAAVKKNRDKPKK